MKVIKDGILKTWQPPNKDCPNCGARFELEITDLRADRSDPREDAAAYFTCSQCGRNVYLAVPSAVMGLLN